MNTPFYKEKEKNSLHSNNDKRRHLIAQPWEAWEHLLPLQPGESRRRVMAVASVGVHPNAGMDHLFKPGTRFGSFVVVGKAHPSTTADGAKVERAVVRCDCSTVSRIPYHVLSEGITTRCGDCAGLSRASAAAA